MKGKIIIGIIILLLLICGYFLFSNKKSEAVFLKLEKITLKEEKKVKINQKEVTIKYQDALIINDKKIEKEVVNLYSTGEYLIVAYKGNQKEKYLFIDNEVNEIEVVKENINEDTEYSNLRLDTNKLVADTDDGIVEISYKEGKIYIKNKDNQ